jgi:CheY-like chemotaxis protein
LVQELKLSWRHVVVGIVDDNLDWRRVLRGMLQSFGVVDLLEASDGADFMRKTAGVKKSIDFLLVDDDMNPMDGFVFMHMLRSRGDHASRRAVAVLMAGHGGSDLVKRALSVGYHSVLPKPFSAAVLDHHAQKALMRPVQWKEEGGLLLPVTITD